MVAGLSSSSSGSDPSTSKTPSRQESHSSSSSSTSSSSPTVSVVRRNSSDKSIHTLFLRSEQQVVVYELQVQEEVEGVRQEVREIERESKGEEKRSQHGHVDGVKDSLLEPRCVCA